MISIEEIKQSKALTKIFDQFGVQQASVFGSVAKKIQNSNSDLDLLVTFYKNSIPDIFTFIELKQKLEEELNTEVDLATENSIDKYMREEVLSQSIPVYAK